MSARRLETLLWPAALLLAACAAQEPAAPPAGPSAYVALLPNADGTVGQVDVRQGGTAITLDKPLQAASLAGPASTGFQVEESQVKKDFGAAMEAMPPTPAEFVLRFEADGARLTAESESTIPKVVAALKGRPSPEVIVVAYADYRELQTWNKVDNPMLLPTGQVIALAPPAAPGGPTHTVVAGETLAGIADRYGQQRTKLVAERLKAAGVDERIITASVRTAAGDGPANRGDGTLYRRVDITLR